MDVTVYTWPYQWLYWPVYRALSIVEQAGTFKFKPQSADADGRCFNDDESIRRALEHHSDSGLGIALCEPPDGLKYWLVPVLWRLPLWVIAPRKLFDVSIPTSELTRLQRLLNGKRPQWFLMEESSTTGRLAGQLLKELPQLQGERGPYERHSFLAACDDSGGAMPIAVVFEPLHMAYPDKVVALGEFPGTTGNITAVAVRRPEASGASDKLDLARRLRDQLLRAVKAQLDRLYYSFDLRADLKTRMREEVLFPVETAERDHGAEMLAVIAERGCFFPYSAIDMAVNSEVQSILSQYAEAMVRDAWRHFRSYLGARRVWKDISYPARKRLLTQEIIGEGGRRMPVWEALAHLVELLPWATDANEVQVGRRELTVFDDEVGAIALEMVDVGESQMQACEGAILGIAERRCGGKERGALATDQICKFCALIGSPEVLVAQVTAQVRAQGMTCEGMGKGFRSSPVSFDDLVPVVGAFLSSVKTENAQIKAYISRVGHGATIPGRILVALEVKGGDRKEDRRLGANGHDLRAWVRAQSELRADAQIWLRFRAASGEDVWWKVPEREEVEQYEEKTPEEGIRDVCTRTLRGWDGTASFALVVAMSGWDEG